jgi:aromatic-L-amino-acid decarboxylase
MPETDAVPLEPDPDELRALLDGVTEFVLRFSSRRADAPASDTDALEDALAPLAGPAPEAGRPLAEVLPLLEAGLAKGFDTTGDGYLAYIPGGGLPTAALGDLIGRITNRFPTVWGPAPGAVQLEVTVGRWLCELFGLPQSARGILTTGGSLANFSAVVAARQALLGEELADGVLYVSEQTHASVAKAAVLAGLPRRGVRLVATTRELRLDPAALRAAIEDDLGAGRRPFAVVATAGTTNTGAVDDLNLLGEIAREHGLWFHVDAAYGGFFQLTERGRRRFAGIEAADSITLDPHKGMFLPYGTGALLVRDGRTLREAHEVHGAYLQDLPPEGALPNLADYSAELSREARGPRMWLPIVLHGLGQFRAALDEKLDLSAGLESELRAIDGLEVPWASELSIVTFRAQPGSWRDPEQTTAELLARINAGRRVFLSSTTIDGRFTIRACILSVFTHRARIDELVAIIRDALSELRRAAGTAPARS